MRLGVRVAVRVGVRVRVRVTVRVGVAVGTSYVMISSGSLLVWLLSKTRCQSTLLASGPRTDTPRLAVSPLIHSCTKAVSVQVRHPTDVPMALLLRMSPTAGWLFHVNPPDVQDVFTW